MVEMDASRKAVVASRPAAEPFDRDRLRGERRAAIVRAAGDMFCSEGYRNIKVEDIAARLGLTKTIVYYYFSSKQALFRECHLRATELLERAYDEAADPDPTVRLGRFVHAYVLSLIGDESPGAVLLDVELLLEEDQAEIVRRREAVHAKLRRLIEAVAQRRGGAVDVKLLEVVMMSALNIIPKWYRRSGAWSPEDVAAFFGQALMRQLGVEGPRRRGADAARGDARLRGRPGSR